MHSSHLYGAISDHSPLRTQFCTIFIFVIFLFTTYWPTWGSGLLQHYGKGFDAGSLQVGAWFGLGPETHRIGPRRA